jgi:RNA polymerase sigma-70 factor (ECF subfamily)
LIDSSAKCHYTGVADHETARVVPIVSTSPPSVPIARSAVIELARTAAAGDVRATRRLLEVVAPRVARTVRAVLGAGHPEVEDAAQLALIGFIQALPTFRGEGHPAQFAARIAVRTAGAVRRRAKARVGTVDYAAEVDALEAPPEEIEAAHRKEFIRGLLDELPEEQAEVLVLRIMLGWALKDIATTSGAPLNTVRSRLRLAKEALRRRIADDPVLTEALNSEVES